MPEITEGRCQTCGFLGVRTTLAGDRGEHPPAVYEASSRVRLYGTFGGIVLPSGEVDLSASPTCAAYAVSLTSEFRNGTIEVRSAGRDDYAKKRNAVALTIIQMDRKCPAWTPYREGVSPKEEFEERRMKELQLQHEKFIAESEAERRAWVAARAAERAAEQRRENRLILWLTIIGVVLAALAVGAVTPDSLLGIRIPVRWFHPDKP